MNEESPERPSGALGFGLGLLMAVLLGWLLLMASPGREEYYEPSYIGACTYGQGWTRCGRG